MASTSVRRSAIVLAVNLAVGLTAVMAPTLGHAAGGRHAGHAAGPAYVANPARTTTVTRVRTRRAQLVRNSGFSHHRRFWAAVGKADPRLQVAHPGYHSAHAARLIVERRGAADVREALRTGPVRAGDRYAVSADVKAIGSRSDAALQLRMYRGGAYVGQRSARVTLHNGHWRALRLTWLSHVSGVQLTVDVRDESPRPDRGVKIDNVRVVRTRLVRVKVTVPVTSGSPDPAPSTPPPSGSNTPTPAPTPTPTDSDAPTPTPTPTSTVPVPGPVNSASPSCTVSAILVPSCGAYFGVYKPPGAGENWETSFTDVESQIGRKLSLVYSYHDMSNSGMSGQFPDKYEEALGANRILMFAWASRNFAAGTQLQWSDIAAGKYDASVINPEAARLKAYGKPVFLTFDPEMDRRMASSPSPGTAAQYVAAYRHIHDVFAADGVTNVIWVWTPTGTAAHDSEFDSLYPGNSYVDWIGYDPYNFASCHNEPFRSFAAVIDPFYQWLENNGYGDKPFMLPEYGTVADPSNPSASEDWYEGVPAALQSHPNIKSVMEWDDSSAGCNTTLTVDPGTMQGFAAAGHSSYFDQN